MPQRDSFDSAISAQTGNVSVYMPRRVESIMGDEDRRKYELAHASQLSQFVTNSRALQGPPPGQVYEFSESELRRGGFLDGPEGPSRPPHRRVASSESINSRSTLPEQHAQGSSADSQATTWQPLMSPPNTTRAAGRSPLARASFTRTTTTNEVDDEIGVSHLDPNSRGSSPRPDHHPSPNSRQ